MYYCFSSGLIVFSLLLADPCFHHAWISDLKVGKHNKQKGVLMLAFSFYISSRRSWDITMGSLSVAFFYITPPARTVLFFTSSFFLFFALHLDYLHLY
jgi:hypothetical protein